MAWTTVDDFETGSLDGTWSGNNAFVVTVIDPLEGTYSVAIDSTQSQHENDRIFVNNSASVIRNSNGDKTVRCLLKDTYSTKGGYFVGLTFFYTDSNNYYFFKFGKDNNGDNMISIRKVVAGVETTLASYIFGDGGATQVQGVEIKAETNLITVNTFTDLSFSVDTGTILTTTDTEFTTGGIGFIHDSGSNGSPIAYYRWDLLEVWDEGGAPAEISKVKVAGTFSSKPVMVKISGTFVEKIMKVRVGGVFQ